MVKWLQYQGYFKHVNSKPKSEWMELFISDWNKVHFALYVYLSKDSLKNDIERVMELVRSLNWRDTDVYTELIDYSKGAKKAVKTVLEAFNAY